jgi:tRNA G18 (ribose-2'-O)-methylase SpoU
MTAPPNLTDFTKDEIKEVLNEVRHPVDVAVYSVGNYFNISSIIRTCHSFLVNNIYLIDVEVPKEPFYPKGTMGNHRYENIILQTSEEFMGMVSDNSRSLVSFERRPGILSPKTIWTYKYPQNPILLFGSETHGVPDKILDISCDTVCIPMYGLNNDMNVAVAAAISISDFIRKHHGF